MLASPLFMGEISTLQCYHVPNRSLYQAGSQSIRIRTHRRDLTSAACTRPVLCILWHNPYLWKDSVSLQLHPLGGVFSSGEAVEAIAMSDPRICERARSS
jgi:hypothetical protein